MDELKSTFIPLNNILKFNDWLSNSGDAAANDEIIKRHLIPEENYIYGFADLTGLLGRKFEGFNYGISIGRKLDNSIVDNIY